MPRTPRGWMYREPASGVTPARIRVRLKGLADIAVFNDNAQGAYDAAAFVTDKVGDDWKLENMHFLGYRIVTGAAIVPVDLQPNTEPDQDWDGQS